jgi:predicted nucleic acid-binding protein
MTWLLDVNALIALGHGGHVDHERVHRWFASLFGSSAEIATCAITELGFVRVSVQAGYEEDVPAAVETLLGLKDRSPIPFRLIPDPLGVDRLPTYVTGPKQITDGHLMELATESSMRLATLDKGIPGAFLITS